MVSSPGVFWNSSGMFLVFEAQKANTNYSWNDKIFTKSSQNCSFPEKYTDTHKTLKQICFVGLGLVSV